MKVFTLILFSIAFEYSVAQTHVQTTTLYQTTSSAAIAKTFSAVSATHDLIIVHLDWDGQSRSISGVHDNKGNSYARIGTPTNWNGTSYRAELWYAYDVAGGAGAITVTATLSGAPSTFSQIYISEYSGIVSTIDPLDHSSFAIGTTAAVNSGAKNTTYSSELVYGASIGAAGVVNTGSGFNNRSTANSNIIEDKTASAIGSNSSGFTTIAGNNWIAQMASFVSINSILPIDLLSFTGHCDGSHIALSWATASESNNDHFSVERSGNGIDWDIIGTVKGHGNSSVPENYSFMADAASANGSAAANTMGAVNASSMGAGANFYFRLQQTDLDDKSTFSKILLVNGCSQGLAGMNIYPNPSNGSSLGGKVNLKPGETYTVEVFDNLGRLVGRSGGNQAEFTFAFSQTLLAGVYYARFSSAEGAMVQPFLVRR